MKRHIFFGVAALTAFLAAILLLQIPASADLSLSPAVASPAPEVSPPIPADYLLALPVAMPDPAEVPPGLTPEQAIEYAYSLTYRQAEPLLSALEHLRAEGRISGFEVRPDLYGVIVKGAVPDVLESLLRVQGITAWMHYAEASPPACAVGAARALSEQVLGLSRMASE
ncbi:MAG: hypothetical protein N0A03_10295, partial [Anaerolineae bacterium]|nr:hypothetical protein [Anaerolineae bacterium]